LEKRVRVNLIAVDPASAREATHADQRKSTRTLFLLPYGFAKAGQRIIIVAGVPLGTPGTTNMVRIAYVGPSSDADM
jgi:pyruvate kinase